MDFNLKSLPGYAKIILPMLPAVAVGVAIFMLVYTPKQKVIDDLKSKIDVQQKEIASKKKQVQNLGKLEAELEKVQASLDEVKYQLPPENEITDLLRQVSDLATENKVPIQSWKPGQKISKNEGGTNYFEIPFSINLSGTYHQLGSFFSGLTSLDRIININDMKLGVPHISGKDAMLTISFNAVTYASVFEPPKSDAGQRSKRISLRRSKL